MAEGRTNSGLNSPRSPFEFIINHLSATEKSVVDCCSVLPNRLRLRKLHDFVSVFLQQGFQHDQSTSVEVDLYLRVRVCQDLFAEPQKKEPSLCSIL
ncbi:hypothetical protein RvY_09670 [Ramazzottius varieornatus]|uniref:Uncharacterized protein n=1 Tax=Ramazzottius varieornatus TaxID=947166 RepID=A0A1D1VJ69_RAMVA|nr:hypothetical protein RvY_09670 [Ramazzottius varieornatus]